MTIICAEHQSPGGGSNEALLRRTKRTNRYWYSKNTRHQFLLNSTTVPYGIRTVLAWLMPAAPDSELPSSRDAEPCCLM